MSVQEARLAEVMVKRGRGPSISDRTTLKLFADILSKHSKYSLTAAQVGHRKV